MKVRHKRQKAFIFSFGKQNFLDLIRSNQNLLQRVHYWGFQETIHFSQGLPWYALWTGISLIFYTTALWAHYVCYIADNLKVMENISPRTWSPSAILNFKRSNLTWSWGEQIEPIFLSSLEIIMIVLQFEISFSIELIIFIWQYCELMKGNEDQQISIANLELELNYQLCFLPLTRDNKPPSWNVSYQLASQQPVNACRNK